MKPWSRKLETEIDNRADCRKPALSRRLDVETAASCCLQQTTVRIRFRTIQSLL